MSLNLLPRRPPTVGIALDAATPKQAGRTLDEQLTWASTLGFTGIELNATGELSGFHAPELSMEVREELRERLTPFRQVVVQAPHQETFDVTLVSPSSAIRRASLSEIWAACRFARAVGASIVTVRTGTPPVGLGNGRRDVYLSECLTSLDKTAGEQSVAVGVLNRDRFRHLQSMDDMQQLALAHTGIAVDLVHARDLGETYETLTAFLQERIERLVYVRAPLIPTGIEAIAATLASAQYSGPIILSPTSDRIASDTDLIAARTWWEQSLSTAGGMGGTGDEGAH